MSSREQHRITPTLIASAIATVFCGVSGVAIGQSSSPINVSTGSHEFTGPGNELRYIQQSGGAVYVHDTILGGKEIDRSVSMTGGSLSVGSGAQLLGGIEMKGNGAKAEVGVGAATQVVIGSSVSVDVTGKDQSISFDNVVINGGHGLGALRVQGDSAFASTTAKTVIHGTGSSNNGVIVGGTASMNMEGSLATSDKGAGIVTIRSASLNMNNVTSIGGRAGLFVQESSRAVVAGGVLKSTGNIAEFARFGDVYGAGVALIGRPYEQPGMGGVPGSLTLSNVTVVAEGSRTAGLVSQAENTEINIAIEDSSIQGGRDGMVFNIDDRDMTRVSSELSRVSLKNSTVTGATGPAIRVSENARLEMVIDGAKSRLTGGNSVALQTAPGSTTNLQVLNDANIHGDVVNQGGTTNITLASGGSWQGSMQGVSNVTVADRSAWTMTGNSSVASALVVEKGGVVKLGGRTNDFHVLTVGKLDGEGSFEFGTNLSQPAAPAGDLLVVQGEANGNHEIRVASTGVEPGGKSDSDGRPQPLTLVKTGGGYAKFGLKDGEVDLGTYYYTLNKSGNDWQLQATGKTTPSANAVVNIMGVSPTIWYGQLMTVRERFGELGFKQDRGGVWVRPYGSQYNIRSASGPTFKQTQSGVAVGADKAFDGLGGKTYLGAVFNYSTSTLDDRAGAKGNVDAYSIGAYATWMGDNGYYLHGLVNANRYISKAKATTMNGGQAEGSFNTNGVGVALEGGRRFDTDSKWFVQPYGQISALHMQGSRFSLNNGMRADGEGVDSLQAAVGTQVGRAFHHANGDVVQPYVRVAVVHEFVKSNDITINDHSFNSNLAGSRLELGVGTELQIGKHLSAHIDYSYAHGNKLTQPYFLNAGLRYQW